MKYFISAERWPFDYNNKEVAVADNLLSALLQFRKFKKKGYNVINIRYAKQIKIDTSNWNQLTMDGVIEDE